MLFNVQKLSFSFSEGDEDFERLANNVRNLKRSMSMKKVTFEDEDYFQFATDSNDKTEKNGDDGIKKKFDEQNQKRNNKGFL